MYNAINIARYIIKYSNEKEYRVSDLKLQKLLYLVQAYFLISLNKPAFFDKIEAWSFGPVVPTVYKKYNTYGANFIPTPKKELNDDYSVEIIDYERTLSKKSKKLIEKVVDHFKDYTATELIELTQKQKPYKQAYSPKTFNEITPENIKEYFL